MTNGTPLSILQHLAANALDPPEATDILVASRPSQGATGTGGIPWQDVLDAAGAPTQVNSYAALPAPSTLLVGTHYFVANDPDPALNGHHSVTGANVGVNGTTWSDH